MSTILNTPEVSASANISQTLAVNKPHNAGAKYWRWIGILLAILLVSVGLFHWLDNSNGPAIRYTTTEATRGDLTIAVTATGTLQPVNQVDVGSEISGTVSTVLVDFNDRVTQGQVLATLNTDQLQARVNQASAALQLAEAQVKQSEATIIETRNTLRRSTELVKVGMTPQEELDSAQAAHARAVADLARSSAQVEQARAALDAEQTTLAKATLRSPIDGIVLNRVVEPGQTVAASFQTPVLFTLAENLAQMELHVDVDEADVGQVEEGQQAEFTVDAYTSQRFPATITEVHFASQTVDGVVTYETVLSVDNSALLLRPGMTATADILIRQLDNALLVPNAALRFKPPETDADEKAAGGGLVGNLMSHRPHSPKGHDARDTASQPDQVWTLRDGAAEPVVVTTGASNGLMTEILSGAIKPGTPVITDTVTDEQ
jgi:HlyD family secretion protein